MSARIQRVEDKNGNAVGETLLLKIERLERENAALREQVVIRDAEIDMWASRCAAAIYMLPETVTGGQLKEAQDRFYLMLEKARKAQP